MNDARFILKSFGLLFKYQTGKLIILIIFSLLLGLGQGFSILLLIPFLQLLDVRESGSSNSLVNLFENLSGRMNINIDLETILIVYAVIFILIAILFYAKTIVQSEFQQGFSYHIRQRLFRRIILADWQVLNSKSKHSHLQVLAAEVPKLALYYNYLLKLLSSGLMVMAYLVFAFWLSVQFTMIILIAGFISFLFLRKFLSKSAHLGSGQLVFFNRLLKYVDDFWLTVKTAKVHKSEEFYYRKFGEVNNSLLSVQHKMVKNYSLPQLYYKISAVIILLLVIYIGYRIENIPLASFFVLIVLLGRTLPIFINMSSDLTQAFSNIPSVRMIIELEDQFVDRNFIVVPDHPGIRIKEEIKIERLNFSYPDAKQIFKEFNAVVPANKITGIIGGSGIGKTTLIDLISGLLSPDSGEINIDGVPLNNEMISGWKSNIGYLPQDAFFIDGTIRENLIWDSGKVISDTEIWEVLRKVNVQQLINDMDQQLDTFIVNYQHHFSGGERQRIALARVLLRKPNLLLLDEATSSLDFENEKLIMDVLTSLKSNITILFVTHRTSLYKYFDHLIKLN